MSGNILIDIAYDVEDWDITLIKSGNKFTVSDATNPYINSVFINGPYVYQYIFIPDYNSDMPDYSSDDVGATREYIELMDIRDAMV